MSPQPNKIILYVLSSAAMLSTLSLLIFLPSISAIREELTATTLEVSMTIALYSLALAAAQLIYGPLADLFKPKTLLLTGLSIFSISSLGIFFSSSIETVIVFRILQALGIASVPVCGNALISDMYKGVERDKSATTFQMFQSIGAALSPAIGATIILFFSWRFTFLFLTLWGAAVFVFLYRKLPGGKMANTFSFPSAARLIRTPKLLLFCLAVACANFILQGYHTAIGFLFTDFLHIAAAWTGYVFMAVPAGVFLGNRISRYLLNVLHREKIIMIGMLALGLSTALFAGLVYLVHDIRVLFALIPNLILIGVSIGMILALMAVQLMNWFSELKGTALSLMFFSIHMFGMAGPTAVGYMVDLGQVPAAFLIMFIIAVFAAPLFRLSLLSHRRRETPSSDSANLKVL